MACILMSCLSAHTLRVVPLISRASVVQLFLSRLLTALRSDIRDPGSVVSAVHVLLELKYGGFFP